jgi:DNA-binding NarL/FixJ family response regulator
VELHALRIDELDAALRLHLGAPIEKRTLNRIYAKTGGHIGLTLALVNAAINEKRMVQDSYGLWVSTGELWSSGLRSVVEAQLQDLSPAARESLEILATLGAADMDTVTRLMDVPAIESMEALGLVGILPSSAHDLVTVVPPLLADYFRHEPAGARKSRITKLIIDRIGHVESVAATLTESARSAPTLADQDALLAGLVREQARTRALVISAEWQVSPTPLNAIRYVTALMQLDSPASAGTVEHVFKDTDTSGSDPGDRAELIALQANWLAHVTGRVPDALDLLAAEGPSLGPYGRILDATEVTILTNLVSVPSDALDKLTVSEHLDPKVQLALLEARLLVLVCGCRFSEAHQAFEQICALDPTEQRIEPRVLFGSVLLGEGRHAEALRLMTRWFEAARGALDLQRLRAFGEGLALCHSHSGDHSAMDRLADLMFAVAEPTPTPSNSQLSLLSVTTSTVAARRGDVFVVERFVAEDRARGLVDGPLTAQALAWPAAQLLILDGKPEQAADELWRSGEALWARGAYNAGIGLLMVALEVSPDRKRLEEATRRLESIPEHVYAQAHGGYVTALVEQDPHGALSSAEALARAGRFGLAVAACQRAQEWFDAAGNTECSEVAQELAAQIRSRIPTATLDFTRFGAPPAVLTEREEEVAKLAASGLTNKEIAVHLFLSVRTVDSHMRRILAKLKLTNRRALDDYLVSR